MGRRTNSEVTESSGAIDYQVLKSIVRERKTLKVLGDLAEPVQLSAETMARYNPLVWEAIADAGMAPFHYDRRCDGIREPWRFHVLWQETCREVAANFLNWFEGVKPNNKLPAMLSACGALILVNWLPESNLDMTKEKSIQVNEEHLSATSAAVQNLLLLLTARGLGTYWSSGGQFRTKVMFDKLGVAPREKLAAAIFVEYPESQTLEMDRISGKHRSHRADVEAWADVVKLDS